MTGLPEGHLSLQVRQVAEVSYLFYCLIRHGAHLCNTNTNKILLLGPPVLLYLIMLLYPENLLPFSSDERMTGPA
jgi:hypothetical protein